MSLTDEQNRFIIEFLASIPPLEDAALRLGLKMKISTEKYQNWLQDDDFLGTLKRILTNLDDPHRRKVFHRWLSEQPFDLLSFANQPSESQSIHATYQEIIREILSFHIAGNKRKAIETNERFLYAIMAPWLDEHFRFLLMGISNELHDIVFHEKREIRRCEADNCDRFFFPNPKGTRYQKYCSPECGDRMRQKKRRTQTVTKP